MSVYDYTMKTIEGQDQSLADFSGKVLLIVNTASKCGLTKQYEGLQKLYDQYQAQGFAVLGFPCNQFAGQEPGTEAEIASFCSLNYQVTFPLFSKIDVNGAAAHPLYTYLKENAPEGEPSGDIEWNFAKFLVNSDGHVIKRYGAKTLPEDLAEDIAAELK